MAVALQSGVKRAQGLVHLGLQFGDQTVRVERKAQRLTMVFPMHVEVVRQVVIGVTIAVGTDDSDFLPAQPLAQGLEYGDFVGDAVGRAGGLPFFDQVVQRLLHDYRVQHLAYHTVRLGKRAIGQLEQQILLTADTLEGIE